MNCYLIEYFDYRTSTSYLTQEYANNEYDAWNMCLHKNDRNGYELGRGELMSKNIIITSVEEVA